jgi:peptidoglycan/LPS O-acetylase OafA/YrhL
MSLPQSPTRHKFLMLDALRGIAAIVVVGYHLLGSRVIPHGYLAVDFFFLLSGFVLALAYQERLDAGWSTLSFLKVRLIRLYPLYILGLGLGLVIALHWREFGAPAQSLRPYAILAAFATLMLPIFVRIPMNTLGVAYPLDYPAWSLIAEIFANLFHGIALRRRSDRFLAGVVIVSGVLLVLSVKLEGTVDIGSRTRGLPEAVPRVLFSYVLGVLLFRVWKRGTVRLRIPFLLSPVLLTCALVMPWCGQHVLRYDLLVIFFFFPLFLLASASLNPPPRLVKTAQTLGRLSYAIYVLHLPVSQIQATILKQRVTLSPAWSATLSLCLVITMSLLADKFYDNPVRASLQRKLIETKHFKALSLTPVSMRTGSGSRAQQANKIDPRHRYPEK